MTTSGIYSVQYTRDQIITAAMRKLGVIAQGQTPSTEDLNNGATALNMLIGMMRAYGMPMWERKYYTFSPVVGQESYMFGTGQAFNVPYPLKVYQLYRITSGTKIDMEIESFYNFNQLPINSSGIPIKGTYHPQNNLGILRLWPIPDSTASSSTFTLVYQQPFQYFINSTDTMDMPEEWYVPLVYKLAVLMAPEWGVPLGDRNSLKEEAEMYLQTVLSMGGEDASMFIQPYKEGWH